MKQNLAKCLIMSLLFIQSTVSSTSFAPAPIHTIEVQNLFAEGKHDSAHNLSYRVTITAYSSTPGQTDSTPFITASGRRVAPNILAISRDLLAAFPFGTPVCLEGRAFIVGDTMDSRWTRRVDVWHTSRAAARRFGVRIGSLVQGRVQTDGRDAASAHTTHPRPRCDVRTAGRFPAAHG